MYGKYGMVSKYGKYPAGVYGHIILMVICAYGIWSYYTYGHMGIWDMVIWAYTYIVSIVSIVSKYSIVSRGGFKVIRPCPL